MFFLTKKCREKKNYFILKRVINIFVIGAIPSDTHNLPRPVRKKKEFLERKTLNSSFFHLGFEINSFNFRNLERIFPQIWF
jgi:hypothetical protein